MGKATVDALLKNGSFNVTALSRESSSSKLPSAVKVITIADDYPQDKLIAAFKGQDAVVNTVLPLDPGLQLRIADAAAEAGIKRYIPTGYGSDITAPKVAPTVPLYLGLLAINDHVKSKESTGLTWTSVVNGGFFDW